MRSEMSRGRGHSNPQNPTTTLTFELVETPEVQKLYTKENVNSYRLSFAVRHNTTLSASQKNVLSNLCDFANKRGICFPHQKRTLEQATSLEKHTIFRAIKELCKLGYIAARRRKGRGCLYLINAPKLLGFSLPPQWENYSLGNGSPCTECSLSYNRLLNRPTILTATDTNTSQQAGIQAAQTPTSEPTELLANCAQQSQGSFADGASPLAQSATLIVQPLSAYGHSVRATKVSNDYYCEDNALF
ncbi:MAG: helix-turn-helix domain-containing protein [Kiritimatiellae bacterium]|nr:helix-turn-helix domain-containing protein [Kiritimatiellia bacterium]